jgi:hypothetical protein
VPGTFVATPSVLVIDSSAVGVRVSVSVAELLAGVGSVTPAGAAIAAVLTKLPVAEALTVAVTVKVAALPTGRFTVALMLPLPLAGHEPPPLAEQVHVAPVSEAGMVSVTVAAVADDGPAFAATMVYVTDVPGTIDATPSVFVIDRSAVGASVSVSVDVLFAAVGSVTPPGSATLAVFTRDPVALDEMAPVTVKVAVPLVSNVTGALIDPEPDAGHEDPAEATQVHVTLLSEAGMVSVTVAAVTVEGPAFEATIV